MPSDIRGSNSQAYGFKRYSVKNSKLKHYHFILKQKSEGEFK